MQPWPVGLVRHESTCRAVGYHPVRTQSLFVGKHWPLSPYYTQGLALGKLAAVRKKLYLTMNAHRAHALPNTATRRQSLCGPESHNGVLCRRSRAVANHGQSALINMHGAIDIATLTTSCEHIVGTVSGRAVKCRNRRVARSSNKNGIYRVLYDES